MRQRAMVIGCLLIGIIGGCDALPLQQEPQLYPYGSGIKTLRVNCEARVGLIRPLIAANRGPINWPSPGAQQWDFTASYRQFGIEEIRSHDFYGPTDWWVIFPDFTAEANALGSYDFGASDQRIDAIYNGGFKCFYRLGTSWKGDNPLPINDPPGTIRGQNGQVIHEADEDDFKKFANICTNIVRHYNQGWNSGRNYGIDYWEIWNEPDMPLQFWTGTPGQYYKLYEETAKAIKSLDPSLKVGGPGLSGSFTDIYLDGLARWCRKTNTPLDFYSWHSYNRDAGGPYTFAEQAIAVRKALDVEGFPNAVNVLGEWNACNAHVQGWRRDLLWNMDGAAFNTAALTYLHEHTDVKYAFRYRGDLHSGDEGYGLVDTNGEIKLPGLAFKAYSGLFPQWLTVMRPEMYRLGVDGGDEGLGARDAHQTGEDPGEGLDEPGHDLQIVQNGDQGGEENDGGKALKGQDEPE